MASFETNERKRMEMSAHLIRLRNLGWTNTQLAVWMGVTPSTVSAWSRAQSMGTNAQRYSLAKMGTPAEERPRILQVAESLRREANMSELECITDENAGAHAVAKYRRAQIARIRARAEALVKLFGG